MTRARGRGCFAAALGLVAVMLLSALPGPAQASKRVALVIGNHEYEHVRPLVNPKKDAADVGAALSRLGFAVTSLDNARYEDLRRGLGEFEEAASRSEIAVVFYAGHGIEVETHNYLVPVEARLKTDRAVKHEAISLDLVMATVEHASRLGLVILDACRDNPFLAAMRSTGLTRSVARGLAREGPRLDTSTLVAYSATEGTTAADGPPGGNSPYAAALLKHLERPGLHVGDLFIEVARELRKTERHQTPVEYGRLFEKVYLASGAPPPPDPDTAPGDAPQSAATAPGRPPPDPEDTAPQRGAADVVLPDGLTLADWALLAEDRLKAGDHTRLLEEATAHLREYGPFESVAAVRERAVSGLVAKIRLTTRDDAPRALGRIAKLEQAAGPRPELLHLKARAHGLLGNRAAEEAAYLAWLKAVPQGHPDRRDVLSALSRVRAVRGAGERFEALLGRPFSAEYREDSAGWTDLHYAALLDLPGVVAALCDAGMAADVRLKEGSPPFGDDLKQVLVSLRYEEFEVWAADGETPLMMAAWVDARGAAVELVACGADVNAKNSSDGGVPLDYASERNALDVAKVLIQHGADLEAKTNNERTPLHTAALHNSLDVAKLLIGSGADVEAKTNSEWTPLHTAALTDSLDVAKLLIEHGANVMARDSRYDTPEEVAVQHNQLAMGMLLDTWWMHISNVNAKYRDGTTPLHIATRYNKLDAATHLIDRGADVHAINENDYGNMPLHVAATIDSLDIAKLLIDRGADVGGKNKPGRTPLHTAADHNSLSVAKLLIESGADVEAKNNFGATPLHDTPWRKSLGAAKLLIESGADVEAKDKDGATPLHYAASFNSLAVAKLLIESGADVGAKDKDGITPLHDWIRKFFDTSGNCSRASYFGRLLIDGGADVNAESMDGRTPWDLAASLSADEIVESRYSISGEITADEVAEETKRVVNHLSCGIVEIRRLLDRHGGRCAKSC